MLSYDLRIRQELENLGYDYETYGMPKPDIAGIHIATPVFDDAREKMCCLKH